MSKTMIDSKVVETAKFLELKPIARDLYTHLLLSSDDEGFVANPKGVVRYIGAKESDLKTLISEGYLHVFPSKVIVILNYWNNNNHDKKNNKPTIFTEEKTLIYEDESHVYRLKESSDNQTERRLNADCKEIKKELTYKERTNQPTKTYTNSVSLSVGSIYHSLSERDRESLITESKNHNCNLQELIQAIDVSIKNRKEQTDIKNPYQYIIQVAEAKNWNPKEINKGFSPVISSPENVVKHYGDIEGSLWNTIPEKLKSSMKVLYEGYDIEEIIKSIDDIIKENPEEEYKGTEPSLFKSLADKYIEGR